ncbi:serine carboxypeptidase-like 50 isoform X3 [Cucurbita pepo subsp. pepo]|uniref:serine carboxypeptidase-like 50 isoform X3 n=1 Tax=Cucurbita pepo subsp. pepo TaxID=3664 RepID=UPI000C9D5057|nr:serine carboxypeptidase-like 50 isoform X3 [Cucurbita pepo subsp. pepo]
MDSTNVLLSVFFFLFFASFPVLATSSPPFFPAEALPTKSGYLPINPTTGSAIYFAFYEAQTPVSSISKTPLPKTPLLIWLQGGPGCSSMIGNFFELGPWRVNFHKKETDPVSLIPNTGSWNRRFGVLFLDNPIGTGFSIAATKDEIPKNQYSVSKHLFSAISSFIEQDITFKNRPIYITGESYAGKYVPSIGYYILKKNPKLPVDKRLNLAGVAIGNGLTDPITQVATHALNAYYSGLINERQKKELEIAQLEAVELTKKGNWSEATNARSKVLNLLKNMTGLATLYDYTRKSPYNSELVAEFLSFKEVKRALGVNESMVFEECSDLVGEVLKDDVMKSMRYKVDYLVKNSKVLVYQGQFDLRDGVVSTEAWLKKVKWGEIERFLGADRKIWSVGDELAGYVQTWKSLSNAVVLGAGHLVPSDQALNSQAMIEDWVLEKGLFGDDNAEEKKPFGANDFGVW